MKKLWMASAILALLVGCGGGGGGNPGLPVTSIEPAAAVSGTLAGNDPMTPDDCYTDLFKVTLPAATTLVIDLQSPEFDTVIAVFDGAALAQGRLLDWSPFLLDVNDDAAPPGTDSRLVISLPPGTYAILVTSFFPGEIGGYTLTVTASGLTPTGRYLQYRNYDYPATPNFRAWVQFMSGDQFIQADAVRAVQLFDPAGSEIIPASPPAFTEARYLSAEWNSLTGQFQNIVPDGYSGYTLALANHVDLPPGQYTFAVDTGGGILNLPVSFPGRAQVPLVASASMGYQWGTDGSLTLSWAPPAGPIDQYRVIFTDQNHADMFYGKVLPGVSQVTLPTELVQQILQRAQATQINWHMQTRLYEGEFNYARGFTSALVIPLPTP